MRSAICFFADPPDELKALCRAPVVWSSNKQRADSKLVRIHENALACLFTAFEVPHVKSIMQSKLWTLQLRGAHPSTPGFCCNGIACLLGCPQQFAYLHDTYLRFYDGSHIGAVCSTQRALYSVGDKLMLPSKGLGKNARRRYYNLLLLEHQSHMMSTLTALEMSKTFQLKDKTVAPQFLEHSNPIRVPSVQYFCRSFFRVHPKLECTKSAFNRRFRIFRHFLLSNGRLFFLVAAAMENQHRLLLDIKGKPLDEQIIHDSGVYAVWIGTSFLTVAHASFVLRFGYNASKNTGHLSDPGTNGTILYFWPSSSSNNQIFDLLPDKYNDETSAFSNRLLRQLIRAGIIGRTSKSAVIKANWVISKLNMSGELHADAGKSTVHHAVYVQGLHNGYTKSVLRHLASHHNQIVDIFIPVTVLGCFMLICTQDQLHGFDQSLDSKERVVYIPYGCALVLPHTVYHACGLQPGFAPVVLLQLQVQINHRSTHPSCMPNRGIFRYYEKAGEAVEKCTTVSPSIKQRQFNQLLPQCDLGHFAVMFLM
jgi:hypothetical protein